ncbi:hypothetical protein V496_09723 [Pseudogymnoascus sp. VKM F-4515 (FW-2607)]|nr:hypothetical protein V496_09723 [Pseudogymnoascus sp. VKM F-4515 (FW-2607)]KFY92393.1 hypothetical protein V498_04993 [Pseudogymnoascus sp. VKM F-4517 (FW-2822)]
MLRRKPTAISITNEDVASYEDRQNAAAEEALRAEMQRAAQMQAQKGQNVNPNDGYKDNRPRQKTREERLGLPARS